jgi:transcriptional/translational regulatory protein YebC/TACO1
VEASAPMVPASTVAISEASDHKANLRLLDLLDDNDDVQEVWDNVDIDDSTLAQVDA